MESLYGIRWFGGKDSATCTAGKWGGSALCTQDGKCKVSPLILRCFGSLRQDLSKYLFFWIEEHSPFYHLHSWGIETCIAHLSYACNSKQIAAAKPFSMTVIFHFTDREKALCETFFGNPHFLSSCLFRYKNFMRWFLQCTKGPCLQTPWLHFTSNWLYKNNLTAHIKSGVLQHKGIWACSLIYLSSVEAFMSLFAAVSVMTTTLEGIPNDLWGYQRDPLWSLPDLPLWVLL